MKTYSFPPYGHGYNSSVVVVLDRITHFEGISFNGIRGTEIHLDTGVTIRTGMNSCDVNKIIVEGNILNTQQQIEELKRVINDTNAAMADKLKQISIDALRNSSGFA